MFCLLRTLVLFSCFHLFVAIGCKFIPFFSYFRLTASEMQIEIALFLLREFLLLCFDVNIEVCYGLFLRTSTCCLQQGHMLFSLSNHVLNVSISCISKCISISVILSK